MARAKPFMEQLQGAIKKFSVKCRSAWVDHNNTAAFGPLSSSDWLTFIAEWIPFHSEQGGRERRERESEGQMGEAWLKGGTMRPEGSWLVMWPDCKLLFQLQKWPTTVAGSHKGRNDRHNFVHVSHGGDCHCFTACFNQCWIKTTSVRAAQLCCCCSISAVHSRMATTSFTHLGFWLKL